MPTSSCHSLRLAAGGGGAGTGRPTTQVCVGCIDTRPCQTTNAGTRDPTSADMAWFMATPHVADHGLPRSNGARGEVAMRRWGKSGAMRRLLRTGGAVAVLGGTVALGLAAPSGATSAPTPVTEASTSARGVSASAINVVFPIISFSSIEGEFEIESDAEYGEQSKAIHLFVNQINDAGGIHGRKINPMIMSFDPTNVDEQRSLCKQWTEGQPPVFAVLDGLGTWEGVNELCITREGHTPMLSQWTTTTNWTDLGSPYLWWTGVDDAPLLAATVSWGLSSGRLGHGKKVGVVVSDQASDQSALNSYLLPDLKAVGVVPQVVTITAALGETASTDSDATLAVERLKAAGIQLVIPLLPENAFTPYIGAETSQDYFPKLLLSDYQSEVKMSRAYPYPLREGAQRSGGCHRRDARWDRPPGAGVTRWIRPGGAELLGCLAQGLPTNSQGQHQ